MVEDKECWAMIGLRGRSCPACRCEDLPALPVFLPLRSLPIPFHLDIFHRIAKVQSLINGALLPRGPSNFARRLYSIFSTF
jgi:hypothetical protein